jgi:hypothetical protein
MVEGRQVRRRSHHGDDAPGQDSFLDIVANLVGILIILVMVVGARAKDALLQVETTQEESAEEVDIETPRQTANALRVELDTLSEKLSRQAMEVAYRRSERDRVLSLVTMAEHTLQEQSQKLDETAQKEHQLQIALLDAQRELDDMKMAQQTLENADPSVTVLRHRPTPLAETVFGKEVHFRLQAGRITYVPINELVERFKSEVKEKTWKLRQAPRITESVGPIRGFHLKYTLKRAEFSVQTQVGAAVQQRVELDHFVLVPIADDLGEPMERAMQPDSEFRAILASHESNNATVTVWVYPNSFAHFRQLKEELFKLGFLTAGRPLPAGQPITGSPSGTRSNAQ